jgi:hypothetical protein
MDNQPTPLKIERGPALNRFVNACRNLHSRVKRQMADMNRLRSMAAENRLRQAEIAAIAQVLVEKKILNSTDEFMLRAADAMDALESKEAAKDSAIFIPGR